MVSTSFSFSYRQTIILKVTESSLEILTIRRAYLNYSPVYKDKGEIEQEHFNKEAKSYYFFYAHLLQVNVKNEYKVRAGEVIGLSGTSGNAKGTKPLIYTLK